ncbi:hypothetical protein AKJ18_19730 [Vibrio xuii]|nr:hypothetical protein AKJ18_19730 [Vibrio xuii]
MKYFRNLTPLLIWTTVFSAASLLLHDIWFVNLPELFDGGKELLTTFYNLNLGVVVSFIFYFIVVHIKEVNDQEHIDSIVVPKISQFIEETKGAQKQFCEAVGEDYDNSFLTKPKVEAVFKKLDPNLQMKILNVRTGNRHTWMSFLIEQALNAEISIHNILRKQDIIEPKVLEKLSLIESCSFVAWFKANPNFVTGNQNMEIKIDKYFDFLDKCSELEKVAK